MAFLREYSLPIIIALLIHAVIVYCLSTGINKQAKLPDVASPKFVVAKTVKLKQEAPKVVKPVVEQKSKPVQEQQKKVQEQQRKLEQQRQQQAKQEKARAEKAAQEKRRLALEKERAEKARQEQIKQAEAKKRQEEQQKKEKEQALAQAAKEDMLFEQLQQEIAQQQQVKESEQEAQSYVSIIQQAVAANWSRPASARNGMEVVLIVQLIPNGTVIDVRVDVSSGNDAFDRSAIAAVKKAERFPELAQMKSVTFERYFRQFTMRFNPDDLRL